MEGLVPSDELGRGEAGEDSLSGAGVAGEWEEGPGRGWQGAGSWWGCWQSAVTGCTRGTGSPAGEAGSRPCPPRHLEAPQGLFCTASWESDSWLVVSALWLLPQACQASQHPSPARPVAGSPISSVLPGQHVLAHSYASALLTSHPPSSLEGRFSSPQLAVPVSLTLGPCCCLVNKCLSLPSPSGSCLLLT